MQKIKVQRLERIKRGLYKPTNDEKIIDYTWFLEHWKKLGNVNLEENGTVIKQGVYEHDIKLWRIFWL